MQYTYKITFHKRIEGGDTVTVPDLPGSITYGEDVNEAIAMAREAIDLMWRSFKAREKIFLMILKRNSSISVMIEI